MFGTTRLPQLSARWPCRLRGNFTGDSCGGSPSISYRTASGTRSPSGQRIARGWCGHSGLVSDTVHQNAPAHEPMPHVPKMYATQGTSETDEMIVWRTITLYAFNMAVSYDLSNSASISSRVWAPSFWASLMYRVSLSINPVPRKHMASIQTEFGAALAPAPTVLDSLELSWDDASLTTIKSDCLSEADRVPDSHHDRRITEDAAIGLAICALQAFKTGSRVTRVAQIGKRCDYYLNDSNAEMIEVSGSNAKTAAISTRAKAKSKQAKASGAKVAWYYVCNFATQKAALQRVI